MKGIIQNANERVNIVMYQNLQQRCWKGLSKERKGDYR